METGSLPLAAGSKKWCSPCGGQSGSSWRSHTEHDVTRPLHTVACAPENREHVSHRSPRADVPSSTAPRTQGAGATQTCSRRGVGGPHVV